jgi:hypothetical protein
VIGSAVVPTLIAQRWFLPVFRAIEPKPAGRIEQNTSPAPAEY